jgi:actin related protein 2/3 complex subunit 2
MKNTELLKRLSYSISTCSLFNCYCRHGANDTLNRLFNGMIVAPDNGFNVAIEFNCDTVSDPERLLNAVCELKRHVTGGPMEKAFRAMLNREAPSPVVTINYRKNETMYIAPAATKVVVIFLVDFVDQFDKAIARVFLQEFVEAQRTVRTAPPVSVSREPPGELASLSIGNQYNGAAGFISFALEERHLAGDKIDACIAMLTGFRNYLHYHIKCSKTYLHMRMRKRVAGWLQILNRAVPEIDTEKKTASGKTFVRK